MEIQTTSKNSQRYYTSKRLIRCLLSNDFFSQNSNLPSFVTFTGRNETSTKIVSYLQARIQDFEMEGEIL